MKNYEEPKIEVPRFNEANGFYTSKNRSELMSKIKSSETKPEIKIRKALWAKGLRYRKNVKRLPGCPDIVLSRYKIIIFIDGEFWHGYNWDQKKEKIKSNREFWIPKIERNIQRDRINNENLKNQGWNVLRFWEKEIEKDFEKCIRLILSYIQE